MPDKNLPPEQVIASLLQGKAPMELKAVLARLERGGASIYRSLAQSERNARAREELLKAADREEQNAKLLFSMTELKHECGKCRAPLPLDSEAYCCSFQRTFCPNCASDYHGSCPNCGGPLGKRETAAQV